MVANTYAKTDKTQLTAHFNITEFRCKGATCGCAETLHDPKLSAYLEKIREHFEKPVYITSGYRCPKHNAETANAASNSRHTKGEAADFYIPGIQPDQIAKFAESIGVLGIGLYDSFVHIDTREKKSFWFGHGQEKRETFGGATANAPVYVVTCRLQGSPARYTLVFDGATGGGIQRIGSSAAAMEMRMSENGADFCPISSELDTAEIISIRTLEVE